MIDVSENFKTLSLSAERSIRFQILTNEDSVTYKESDIIDIQIERSVCGGGLSIGNVIAARLSFTVRTADKIKAGTRVTPYVRFERETNSEWLRIGRFYVNKSYVERGYLYVTAYDRLYNTDKVVGWGGRGDIKAISFPSKMQDMLDYICILQGLTNSFKCNNYTVETKPEGYTRREILGYIAACHAGNAVIDNEGNFNIKKFTKTNYEIPLGNCFEQTIDNSEAYKVNGILFSRGDDSIYIDGSASEYDDEAAGIIHCDNPFASIEVAENVWHELGGLEYYACSLDKQAFGWLECGDVVKVKDLSELENPAKSIVITSLEYSVSCEDGFTERLSSEAETTEQSSNSNNKKSVSSAIGAGGSAGTVVYYDTLTKDTPLSAKTEEILSISFSATSNTIPLYGATVQLDITATGTVDFILIYDSMVFQTFTQTFAAGASFRSLNIPLIGTGNGGHKITLSLKASGSIGSVPKEKSYAFVNGSQLSDAPVWDGTITAKESFKLTAGLYSGSVGINFSDSLIFRKQNENNYIFTEKINIQAGLYTGGVSVGFSDKLITNSVFISAYKKSNTELAATFSNPVEISGENITGITLRHDVEVPVYGAVADGRELVLTVPDLSYFLGRIIISYDKNSGNLFGCFSGKSVESFNYEITL